ncbi:MAG: selenocysteine-specific translation elongation factor [Candidatus Binatia bacterium]
MPHIIGTAGHIDHGKTALIRALTGQDTDRLKEEKERGISIDLGFAYMDLAGGERVGIVDVPGHERLIRNMLAGAHGIDLVLLVVAADDGVMPQTEEHLDILHLLGAAHGVVAVTKTDLVNTERLAAVQEEVEILLAGTTLEGSPVIPVSSVTGAGLDALRRAIEDRLAGYERRAPAGYFRLPVDRAFVMRGHGTVVTGTAVAGTVVAGDLVRVLPSGEEARVRTVQVHGREVAEATWGQRVALNLAGVERTDVTRGHVICDPRLDRATDRFDARVEIRPAASRPVKSHETVRVYLGTAEVIGKLVLLDGRDQLPPRESAYAQLVLRQPVHALRGDPFVLRNQSAERTIGGGVVVHPFARRHRRGERQLLPLLERLRAASNPTEVVEALLDLEPAFAVSPGFLAQAGGLPLDAVGTALHDEPTIRALPDPDNAAACTTSEKWEALHRAVVHTLAAFHQRTPLAPGMEMESLRSQIAPDLSPKIFRAVLDALVAQAVIARAESIIRLPSHRVALRRDEEQLGARAEALITAGGFTPPDLKEIESRLAVGRQRLPAILQQLEREGRVAKIAEGLYFGRAPLAQARTLLRDYIESHGDISAATFRDLLGASRKFSIALLDYFDRTGFTLRVGDVRKLRASSR